MKLDCYRHRGYWFHGRNRERAVMEALAQLVSPGQTVVEIGGHIGYVALRLRQLVGPGGRVVVFEPGPNNLPYLRTNAEAYPNVEIVEAACSDESGEAEFWIENLTGQNNTLVRGYKEFAANRRRAYSAEVLHPIRVKVVTLDSWLEERGVRPDFLKIDVEGAELLVLRGARRCLERWRPRLIVEVTENAGDVAALLSQHGYSESHDGRAEWTCLPTAPVGASPDLTFRAAS